MRVLEGSELEEAIRYMNLAVKVAKTSPCRKEKRGAIIVKNDSIIGQGVNEPPKPFKCEPSYCGDSCRVPAVHAEMNAIIDSIERGYNLKKSRMYHARTEDGILQDSRKPRCADCSKHILKFGVEEIILKHEEGYTLYDSVEFHKISLENHRKRNLK